MSLKDDLGSFAYGISDAVAQSAPEYMQAYARMVGTTAANAELPRLSRELIGLAVNAAVTHLNRDATVAHIIAALECGASDREIFEVLQLASCLGMHTIVHGVPLLVAAAPELMETELSERQRTLKEHWVALRGYWPAPFDGLLALDPEYFAACSDFQNAPFGGAIDRKLRELIFVAIDASTTHMYANVDRHIRLALEYGATPDEVLATLEITALIGVQSYTLGFEALAEARARLGDDDTPQIPVPGV